MKLKTLILFIGIMLFYASIFSQGSSVNVSLNHSNDVFKATGNESRSMNIYANQSMYGNNAILGMNKNQTNFLVKDVSPGNDYLNGNYNTGYKQINGKYSSQQIQVSGTIISSTDSLPLPGVSVVEKGTKNGTITDIKGKFSLTVSGEKSILVLSFLGFVSKEVSVNGKSNISVVLQEDVTKIDEVIVVGYGTSKRSDLTGAVASVSEDKLKSSVVTNIDQALQGRVAGVQVTQNSGQPGGAVSIRIRGASSITGSNEPLYVIDGIPFQGNGSFIAGFDWAGGANGQSRVNPLSTINPNDIVDMQVLKDASASAIYGAQAANGVVLITTRQGKKGETKVMYNTYFARESLPKRLDIMNLPEFAAYQLEIKAELDQEPEEKYMDPSLLGEGTDWQGAIFSPSWTQSHQLSVTSGTDKTTYVISGGYYNQDGIIIGSDFNRVSTRMNMNSQVKDWIKVEGGLNYTRTAEKITLNDGGDGVIMNALVMQPDIPVKNFNGEYDGPSVNYSGASYNPVALALIRNNTLNRERIMGNFAINVDIVEKLTFRSEFGLDNNNSINVAFHPTFSFGAETNDLNKMRQREENSFFWVWKNYITYDLTYAEKHNLVAMVGTEAQKSLWQAVEITKENFISNDIHVLSQGDNTTSRTNGWKDPSSLLSYYGRFNYNYDNRYLATFTLRADGSSRFGPENKWGLFPSGSLAWRLSEESFLSNVSMLNNLKLRLGYGTVGNQSIGSYLYGSLLEPVDSYFGKAYRMRNIKNDELKWETTVMYNLGLDLAILDNAIEFTAEVYNKQTRDMLLQLSVPSYIGGPNAWQDIAAPFVNVGKMENKGFEFSIVSRNIRRNKFEWSTDVNFTHNKNKIKELDNENKVYWGGLYFYPEFTTVTMTKENKPIGVFYGYETEGLFQNADEIRNHAVQLVDPASVTTTNPKGENLINKETGMWIGDIKFKDQNGDSVINTDDQVILGDPNPDFTFGITNSLKYGPFNFSIGITGSYGAEILNYSRVQIEGQTSPYNNQAATVNDRAQFELIDPLGLTTDPDNVILANPGTSMPRFATNDNSRNNRMSDRYIENGSYLRIQNVSIAYTVPNKIINKAKISRLRVYVNLQNLYTFTRYSGYDPEIGAFNQNARMQNIDMGRYPSPRMYTFGLDVEF